MGIFNFNTPPEPADPKTAVSPDAAASDGVPRPAAEMTPPRVEPPPATPPRPLPRGLFSGVVCRFFMKKIGISIFAIEWTTMYGYDSRNSPFDG